MTRLDTQRAPRTKHARPNSRKYVRGYDTVPHDTWGEASTVPATPTWATGATAGIPGSWTPGGSVVPVDQASVMTGDPVPITPSPATAWTTGQYVQTQTAGAAGRVCWTGSAWVGGAAP
jgi:hypothetical protein